MHEATWAVLRENFETFREAIFTAGIAGFVLGWLGVFVVLRRMVFVSAAVTESAAVGVALSFYVQIHWGIGVDPVVGAATMALVITLLLLPQTRTLSREAMLGLVYASAGGAALVIGSRISQEAHDIQSILFGNAVVVDLRDAVPVFVVAALVMVVQLWWWRGFLFVTADPIAARVQGVPVRLIDGVLLVSIGLTIGVSARALGALPVFAFSTLPATAALMLPRATTLGTCLVAGVIGAIAGLLGYLLAFFEDFPVGGAQALTCAGFVLVAWILRLVSRWVRGLLRPTS